MVKNFTIFFKFSNIRDKKSKSAEILKAGLRDQFSPSDATIGNIMAFARAHRTEKTKNAGSIELVIN
jgi:hypothetical protein